jgi:hypothetical protein
LFSPTENLDSTTKHSSLWTYFFNNFSLLSEEWKISSWDWLEFVKADLYFFCLQDFENTQKTCESLSVQVQKRFKEQIVFSKIGNKKNDLVSLIDSRKAIEFFYLRLMLIKSISLLFLNEFLVKRRRKKI